MFIYREFSLLEPKVKLVSCPFGLVTLFRCHKEDIQDAFDRRFFNTEVKFVKGWNGFWLNYF